MEDVVEPVLRAFSAYSRSHRLPVNTYSRLLDGGEDKDADETGTVTDSVTPLGIVSRHSTKTYEVVGFRT